MGIDNLGEPSDMDPELTELQDIEAILDRRTGDGPGDVENLPPSDFVSYATEGVEKGTV